MRTRSTYDPFGWRLDELTNPDLNPLRRNELLEGLLTAEAEELAIGRAHLTIVHGEPTDIAEAEELNDFYDSVEQLVEKAEWSRLAGGSDYLTVTLAGPGHIDWLACVSDDARRRSDGRWQIIEAPRCPATAGHV